ncbi:MAG: carbonic anhydrase [Gammaproteobacteria bacterium]|nr:carbonic anhydrase [Gammaproteobacteria bacterium]
MLTADEAIERLKEGNSRFVSEERTVDSKQRPNFNRKQKPFAIILGCSDSRVPAEIVFDQGLGDLFVIRVAGNIVAPSQVGSVEFAADQFGTPLVVVLGHSRCGAVMATIEELAQPSNNNSTNVLSIVNRIKPVIEPLFATDLKNDPDKLLDCAIHANIMSSTNQLMHGSQVLENLIQNGKLKIIGAEYCLETGIVNFFNA